jgi:hypothetical protein
MLASTLLSVLVPNHIGCSHRHRLPEYTLANTRFESARSHNVHTAAEKCFEFHLQSAEVHQGPSGFELYEEIYITFPISLPACDGPEDPHLARRARLRCAESPRVFPPEVGQPSYPNPFRSSPRTSHLCYTGSVYKRILSTVRSLCSRPGLAPLPLLPILYSAFLRATRSSPDSPGYKGHVNVERSQSHPTRRLPYCAVTIRQTPKTSDQPLGGSGE